MLRRRLLGGLVLGVLACGAPAKTDHVTRAVPLASPVRRESTPSPKNDGDTVVRGSLRFVFQSSATSNLVYQIACLARSLTCSREAFAELWKNDLGWTKEDDEQIDRWRRLTTRYDAKIELVPEGGAAFPYWWSSPAGEVNSAAKLGLSGYGAADARDFGARVSLVVAPSHVEQARAVVLHFQPRFERWWEAGPRAHVESFGARVVGLMDEKHIFGLIDQLARVDGDDPARSPPVYVHYVARPPKAGVEVNQMIENHSLVETRVGEDPGEMLDGTLHEIQHYFFREVPYRLGPAFVKSPRASALSAFNLLDEAMATASQALVLRSLFGPTKVADKLARPRSLYDDDAIDRVGKALIPTLERMIAARTSVDAPDFIDRYFAIANEALGPALEAPKLRLRTSVVAYDGDELWKTAHELHDRVYPTGMEIHRLDKPEVLRSLEASRIAAGRRASRAASS
jgi:hypothetical protein